MTQDNIQQTPTPVNEDGVSLERDIIVTESGFTIDRTKGEIASHPDWQLWLNESAADLAPLLTIGHMGGEGRDGEDTFSNVIEHTAVVDANALIRANALNRVGVAIDIGVVHTGAVLHDIGKRAQIELKENPQSERGAIISKALLWEVQKTYPYVINEMIQAALFTGRVKEIFMDEIEMDAAIRSIPVECLIVALADATVRNTKVVSLEEAFAANVKKKPSDEPIYRKWFVFYSKVAAYLGKAADVTETDVLETARMGLTAALGRNTVTQ